MSPLSIGTFHSVTFSLLSVVEIHKVKIYLILVCKILPVPHSAMLSMYIYIYSSVVIIYTVK